MAGVGPRVGPGAGFAGTMGGMLGIGAAYGAGIGGPGTTCPGASCVIGPCIMGPTGMLDGGKAGAMVVGLPPRFAGDGVRVFKHS